MNLGNISSDRVISFYLAPNECNTVFHPQKTDSNNWIRVMHFELMRSSESHDGDVTIARQYETVQ